MAEPVKPVINLNKAATPASPGAIRVGMNAKTTTTRIDISAIPAIAKAQTSRIGLGAAVQPAAADEDIYKRRTALLDTSKIPLKTSAPAAGGGAASPRTIRIGNRPTVRLTPSSAPATFSPGRPAEAAESAAAPRPAGTIKLKRPSGASSPITLSTSSSSGSLDTSSFEPDPSFTIGSTEEETGAVWSVFSLLSLLVLIGLVVVQIMTNNGMAY